MGMAEGKDLEEARTGLLAQIGTTANASEEAENQRLKQVEAGAPTNAFGGLRDRTEIDFPYPEWRLQRAALKEYRRTLEEFRQTGAVAEKELGDFCHLINPPNLPGIVFLAYCAACEEIERWQEEQAKPEVPFSRSDALGGDAQPEPEEQESERDRAEDDENAAEDEEGAEGREREADAARLRTLLEERRRLGRAQEVLSPERPVRVSAAVEPVRTPVILRGVEFEPHAPGHWTRRDPRLPQLDIAPPPADLPAADDQTETLLNAIIGECHFLMREVAFRSLCQEQAAEDRVNWVGAALRMAETGAKVAKSVARLRHGPKIQESHHKVTVENKVAVVAQGGGGPSL
jgi:hypothetical protein